MMQSSFHEVYPWDDGIMDILHRFDIGPFIFPAPTPTIFALCFAATIGLVWVALLDAVYVGKAFSTNTVTRVWPLHILRAAVSVIITAGT